MEKKGARETFVEVTDIFGVTFLMGWLSHVRE